MPTTSHTLHWDRTSPSFYETQAPDGSIWRWEPCYGVVSEVTDMHPSDPSRNASMVSQATRVVLSVTGA